MKDVTEQCNEVVNAPRRVTQLPGKTTAFAQCRGELALTSEHLKLVYVDRCKGLAAVIINYS